MKNIQLFETQIDLSSGPVTIPQNSNADQQVLINSFELTVPSTINVDVQYSIDGVNFVTLYSGLTNAERKKGGVIWRSMKFTKNSGTTSTLDINFAQGISTNANTPDASTTGDAESNPSTTRTGSLGYAYNGSTWDRIRSGIVAVATSFVGWINTLPGLRYNATPPTLADGNIVVLQGDVNGLLKTREGYQPGAEDNTNGVIGIQNKPLAVSTYTWSIDASAALEASTVTKATAGVLRSVVGRVDSTHATATYYWQVYNAASLPADGAVTLLRAPVKIVHTNGTDTNFSIDCTDNGIFASTGIVMALSTTEFTKTISGAFTSTNVLFK